MSSASSQVRGFGMGVDPQSFKVSTFQGFKTQRSHASRNALILETLKL
jgi:hypothetical protein